MIEDQELCDLFRVESETYLRTLSREVRRLGADPLDHDALKRMFLAVHTFHGMAGLLGLQDIVVIAQPCEELLMAVMRGEQSLAASTLGCLHRGIVALRGLVHEVVTGEPARIDVASVSAQLVLAASASPGQHREVPL